MSELTRTYFEGELGVERSTNKRLRQSKKWGVGQVLYVEFLRGIPNYFPPIGRKKLVREEEQKKWDKPESGGETEREGDLTILGEQQKPKVSKKLDTPIWGEKRTGPKRENATGGQDVCYYLKTHRQSPFFDSAHLDYSPY